MTVHEDLKAYLDGETTPDRTAEIEAAMRADADLRREADELRAITLSLKEGIGAPEPVGLERTLQALSAKRRPLIQRPAFAWAACLLVFLVVGAALFEPPLGRAGGGAPSALEAQPAEVAGTLAAPASDQEANAPKPKTQGRELPSNKAMMAEDDKRIDPKIVRKGSLTVEVANPRVAQAQATNAARALGGYVENTSARATPGAARVDLVLRLPENRFEAGLNRLRALGRVASESSSGEDVTAQIADSAARVRVMKAEEESYVAMLRNARKVGDLLEIKDRLSDVRQEIESLAAQEKALRHDAKFSTIALTLVENAPAPAPKARWQDQAWSGALSRGAAAGRGLAKVGMNLFVLAPFWIPVLACGWWLARRRL